MVVLDHSFNYINFFPTSHESVAYYIKIITDMLSMKTVNLAMPMFFTISGFLLFKDYSVKTLSFWKWYRQKISDRIKTLCVPYIIWNIIWMIAFMVIGKWGRNNIDLSLNPSNIFSGIFLYKYNEVYWYMLALMIYVVISPVIYIALKNIYIGIIALIFIFMISNNCFHFYLYSDNCFIIRYFIVFNSIFFFSLGIYTSLHISMVVNRVASKKIQVISLVTVLVSLWVFECIDVPFFTNGILRLTGMVSLWILLDITRKFEHKWYMKYSFFIYSMHKPIQQIYNKIIAFLFPKSIISYLINLYGGLFFTLAVILIIGIILQKTMPLVFGIMNGGRVRKR